ncbi:PepSY domain-containing protein [Brasilonema sp. CT11]|nr:PepSY domain-containing protein [Brasilonema sp. CT11]
MQRNFRKIHHKVAPVIFLPLLASALTGMTYRLGRSWFGMPSDIAEFMMVIHQGEYLGKPLIPVYILLVGLGLLGMIVTGLNMMKFRRISSKSNNSKPDFRVVHRVIAPIIFLPLAVTAVTGILFRVGKNWFGMSGEQAALFLRIHQGSYLGSFFRPFYVLLLGLGLLAMLVTGINMTGIFRKRRVSNVDGES